MAPVTAALAGLDVDAVLGPGGVLQSVLPGYEHRPAQLALARAVHEALAGEHFLLAEAGTGTGKTLAYLVPALLSGRRVVVSTATKTLQEQIAFKDLPLLRQALQQPLPAALLKGRANYLCALRFEAFDQAPRFVSPADAAFWPQLRDWAFDTRSGDRAETPLPEDWPTWVELSTTTESCLGSRCPLYDGCFVTRARREAAEARLIIVNHALYFADLALKLRGGDDGVSVLPAHEAVVFDEAHALEDVATEHFGVSVTLPRLAGLAVDVLEELGGGEAQRGAAAGAALALKARGEALFSLVESRFSGGAGGAARLTAEDAAALAPSFAAARESLAALQACCPEEDEKLGPFRRRCEALGQALEVALAVEDGAAVHWVESRARGSALRAAPIEVGPSLRQALYGRLKTAIFTSATLTAPAAAGRDAFTFTRARLGLPDDTATLRVDSPFDYPRQAALYLPSLPEPKDPRWSLAFAREAFRLVRLTGGRAFLLFTSLKHLHQVHEVMAPHLKVPCLKQGETSRRELLAQFLERPSVLFGSQAFWEGVDVPGEALSLVVIDKLPFTPPDEPLQAARMAQVETAGGAPFDELQVPQAALSLRQGFGRLIRTRTDRGIVALGDARVKTRRYGQRLLQALPPARRVERFDEVARWWAGPGED